MSTEPKTLTREDILHVFVDILNDHQGENFTDITEETLVAEKFPEMDDLDRVEVIMEVEAAFSIVIGDDEIMESNSHEDDVSFNYKLKSIGQWIDFIQDKINPKDQNG